MTTTTTTTYNKLAKSTSPQGWSDLPNDYLITISNKITDITDFIHFRGVCHSWRAAAKPKKLPLELPWLLLPYEPESPSRYFYSRSTGRVHNFHCPEIQGRVVCGSYHGWFVLISQDSSLSLWNPITRAEIILPPPTGFPLYRGPTFPRTFDNYGTDEHCVPRLNNDQIRRGYPWKVSLSCSPSRGAECVVIVVLADTTNFAYCRVGDESWTILDTTLSSHVNSVVFLDHKFCVIDWEGNGVVLDLGSNPPMPTAIKSRGGYTTYVPILGFYLLSVAEEVLMVHGFVYWDKDEEEMEVFEVWKLDMREKKWVQLFSIGELAIFLSGNHASAVRAGDFPGCRGDCIYFSNCESDSNTDRLRRGNYCMDVFRLKDDKFGLLSFRWGGALGGPRSATWLTPCLC